MNRKFDYPDLTEGARIAAEVRAKCNKWTQHERNLASWQFSAYWWKVKVPYGVNPKRLKKYRRKVARYQSTGTRMFGWARRHIGNVPKWAAVD